MNLCIICNKYQAVAKNHCNRCYSTIKRSKKLINRHFGLCVVLEFIGIKQIGKRRRAFLKVVCKCGRKWEVRSDVLKGLKSCGKCLNWLEGEAAFSELYGMYKKRALARFGFFGLNKNEFRTLTKQQCYYCGSSPGNVYKKKWHYGAYVYNGIDRFENTIGYTIENSFPCCKICNYAKRDMSIEKFNIWLNNIKNKQGYSKPHRSNKFFPTRSIFFDVDDTLVMWPKENEDFNNDKDAILISYQGFNFYLKPNKKHIDEIKEKYKEGYELCVWSYGTKEWAYKVLETLNLLSYIDQILSKPDLYYDDKEASDFLKIKDNSFYDSNCCN